MTKKEKRTKRNVYFFSLYLPAFKSRKIVIANITSNTTHKQHKIR